MSLVNILCCSLLQGGLKLPPPSSCTQKHGEVQRAGASAQRLVLRGAWGGVNMQTPLLCAAICGSDEPQVGLTHGVFGSSQRISSSRLSQSINAFWAASHNVEAGNQCTLWSCLPWVPLLTAPGKIQGSDLLSSAPVSRGPAPERFPNNICSTPLNRVQPRLLFLGMQCV